MSDWSDWTGWRPDNHADAVAVTAAGLDFLHGAAAQLPDAALGEVLLGLQAIASKLAATRAVVLGQFDAAGAHDADGYQNSSSWLRGKAGVTRPAAKGQVKQMRSLRARPLLAGALGEGWLSESYVSDIITWTKPLPPGEKSTADEILLGALRAGATLDDAHLLATAIIENWKAQRPDPDDDPDDGFDDRSVRLDTTMDGAGHLTGNLTPQAAAALQAVLESLGKKQGREDTRTDGQRHHDALLDACSRLLGAQMLPQRAGSSTRADVHIPFSELHAMEGAGVLEEAWLRAKSGEHGWLLGEDARAAACDALMVPIVTATPDWPVIGEMIQAVLDAFGWHGAPAPDGAGGGTPGGGTPDGIVPAAYRRPGSNDGDGDGVPRLPLPAGDWDRLLYALGKLAIKFVSGPGAIASVLRTGLLPSPFNTKSVPLDIGYSDRIPEPIRRGVIARARGRCEWPGGCDRPASASDIHHITHKADGGPTSVEGSFLGCKFHHLVCIHKWGWSIELRADGVMIARGPDGQVLGPPGSAAA